MVSIEVREEVERLIREIGQDIKVSGSCGGVLANIQKLKFEPVYQMQKYCDCLNCRLGKINQCQTFRPSKKGKRK